jgi:hypothetical protein
VNLLERFINSQPGPMQTCTAKLLSVAWKIFLDSSSSSLQKEIFSTRIYCPVQAILVAQSQQQQHFSSTLFVSVLMQELVPFLPAPVAMSTVGSLVLAAAAQVSHQNPTWAVAMVHTLATVRTLSRSCTVAGTTSHTSNSNQVEQEEEDSDELLHLHYAQHCIISGRDKEQLGQVCMAMTIGAKKTLSDEQMTQAAIAAKTTAFMSVVVANSDTNGQLVALYRKASNYIVSLIIQLSSDEEQTTHRTVSLCVGIDALAQLSSTVVQSDGKSMRDVAAEVLKMASPTVENLILSNPKSFWVAKSGASFAQSLQKVELGFSSDNANELFDKMIPNLQDSNHFRRLHSLEILCSFPKRPFVMDHADLDLSEDLDEEQDASAPRNMPISKGISGVCTIMDTLLAIEMAPIYFSRERYVSSLISKVEVLGRTGKLPTVYAEAAAGHMLGLLYIKFAPIWPAAAKALAALSKGHENCVWPPAQELLSRLMSSFPNRGAEAAVEVALLPETVCDPVAHHHLCVDWESSDGQNASLFWKDIESAREEGRPSRHRFTDEWTVLESLWKVFEEAPQLLMKHSRTMVPVVLRFLHNQYYFVNPEDPDARELCLSDHVVPAHSR